MIRISIK